MTSRKKSPGAHLRLTWDALPLPIHRLRCAEHPLSAGFFTCRPVTFCTVLVLCPFRVLCGWPPHGYYDKGYPSKRTGRQMATSFDGLPFNYLVVMLSSLYCSSVYGISWFCSCIVRLLEPFGDFQGRHFVATSGKINFSFRTAQKSSRTNLPEKVPSRLVGTYAVAAFHSLIRGYLQDSRYLPT